jgi:hypothetical protein
MGLKRISKGANEWLPRQGMGVRLWVQNRCYHEYEPIAMAGVKLTV